MTDIQPQPDMIGGVPTPPLVILPRPARLFTMRADRFDFLAQTSALAPYLRFLGALSRAQAGLCDTLDPVTAVDPAAADRARSAAMPPIDRHAVADDPALAATLDALLTAARDIDMPAPARLALDALAAASPEDRRWLIGNVLDDTIPADSAAPHLFVAAAVQVHLARIAATLDAKRLVPVRTGVCPCCGGKPSASVVTGMMGAEGARYAACAGCQTLWNEVRLTCLACGTTKGVSFRAVGDDQTGNTGAQIKAETCDSCGSWVKQMDQHKNPTLDPIADDVGSLGLDVLMQSETWKRAGFDPFLIGY